MSAADFALAGHGIVLPIVGPLVAGALLVVLEGVRSRWVRPLSLAATALWLVVALLLLAQADGGLVQPYLLGNWAAPFGIVLALDRLAALMLLLTALVALAAQLYAAGRDEGGHFHSLFQFQLMGINGAFLTADLFNLFVFFEVLLAASYGLLLHGSAAGRRERMAAGVQYVALNLVGSALFLIAASMFYGITGTLSMADLAIRLPQLPPESRALAAAAGGLLLVVFALKAALLPLYFWLPATYPAAGAPAAAIFALLTKVGVVSIIRVATLGIAPAPGVLLALALATLLLAAIGALAAQRLRGLVAYLVVGSAATVLVALAIGSEDALAAGLFYLGPSTLAMALWFLLAERIGAQRGGSDRLAPLPLAAGWAPLGAVFFVAALAAAGLPPLAGFLGKAWLLQAAGTAPHAGWTVAVVLTSSLVCIVALARAGAVIFWQAEPAAGRAADAGAWLAIGGLLAAVAVAAAAAGPLSRYSAAAAGQLMVRTPYVQAVMGAAPVPPVHDVRREMRERGELP